MEVRILVNGSPGKNGTVCRAIRASYGKCGFMSLWLRTGQGITGVLEYNEEELSAKKAYLFSRVLKRERTDHCKKLRRIYGDNSGMVRFTDKKIAIGGIVMNTITTLPSKDNLIFEIYDSTKKNE